MLFTAQLLQPRHGAAQDGRTPSDYNVQKESTPSRPTSRRWYANLANLTGKTITVEVELSTASTSYNVNLASPFTATVQ
ncbi:hypothetical protein BDN72DRAFT_904979 [Pluteus cervinus]|uniref:Uncharacterized protein n=1 Tax=Pluteus cervinus TaxID=181527 RepID=A0ACD3A496_9AGAR|nr:hypothetical protein BDN72DRAFT_904979 [Pluteus cervinus]